MIGVSLEHAPICSFRRVVLPPVSKPARCREDGVRYVFLLLMDMSNLEPDILIGQRSWRIGNNVLEALDRKSVSAHLVFDQDESPVPLSSDCISAVACR